MTTSSIYVNACREDFTCCNHSAKPNISEENKLNTKGKNSHNEI